MLAYDGGLALFLAIGFSLQLVDKARYDQEQQGQEENSSGVVGVFSSAGLRSGGGTASLAVKPGSGHGSFSSSSSTGTGAGGASSVRGGSSDTAVPKIPFVYDINRVYARDFISPESVGMFHGITQADKPIIGDASSSIVSRDSNTISSSGIRGGEGSSSSSSEATAAATNVIPTSTSTSTARARAAGMEISSSNPREWPIAQQDFSEFYYLCSQLCICVVDAATTGQSTVHEGNSSGGVVGHNNGVIDKHHSSVSVSSSLSSPLVPLLSMSEPDPETADGMAKWLEWFDGLKAAVDTLNSLL